MVCACVSDGASDAAMPPVLCPPGLECLLDAGQLVTHMGNLRHDYSSLLVLDKMSIIANSSILSHVLYCFWKSV